MLLFLASKYVYIFSFESTDTNLLRSEVSKASIMVIMSRCEFILKKFLADENDLGASLLLLVIFTGNFFCALLLLLLYSLSR